MIPSAMPSLSALETQYVNEAMESGWLSHGPFVEKAHDLLCEKFEVAHALTTTSGTTALHLALLALGVREGDEVITTDLSYIATANMIRECGAVPVLVDTNGYWQIDESKIEEKITPRTRGILSVTLYGHPSNLLALRKIADRHGLFLMDDTCEGHSSLYEGLPIGTFADITVLSFFGNKAVAIGEGGAVLTNSGHLFERMSILRGQGQGEERFVHPSRGFNYRLSNVPCAILCAQLERMDELIEARWEVYRMYDEVLAGIPGISFQPDAEYATLTPWLYSILVDEEHSRDHLMRHLWEKGIDSRPFFKPVHHQIPHFPVGWSDMTRFERRKYDLDHFPHATKLSKRGVNLPTFGGMTATQIQTVADAIRSFIEDTECASA